MKGQHGPVTGDAADETMDPIVNLRDANLIELYLHRSSRLHGAAMGCDSRPCYCSPHRPSGHGKGKGGDEGPKQD